MECHPFRLGETFNYIFVLSTCPLVLLQSQRPDLITLTQFQCCDFTNKIYCLKETQKTINHKPEAKEKGFCDSTKKEYRNDICMNIQYKEIQPQKKIVTRSFSGK